MVPSRTVLLLAALSCIGAAPAPKMLPDRLLRCTLARMTNFDPKQHQSAADIVYEGKHPFVLLLPNAPVRTTPPPEITAPADPVDPRTRVVADPDGLTQGFPNRFDRVVDLWPERVEMTTAIDKPLVNMIIVHPIDPTAGTATMFMTRASDLSAYDLSHIYSGSCEIITDRPPT